MNHRTLRAVLLRSHVLLAALGPAALASAQEEILAQPPMAVGGGGDGHVDRPAADAAPVALEEPRGARGPRFRLAFAAGRGRLEHHTDGVPAISDDTTAGMGRLSLEIVGERLGGGVRLDGLVSDDNLFFDTAGIATEATDGELFVHLTAQLGSGDQDLPLRVGVFFRGYQLEEAVSGADVRWASAGFRGEFEPDLTLTRSDDVRLSAGGLLGIGFGATRVSTDPGTFEADTTMIAFDAGAHLRLQLQYLELELGWLHRATAYAESDVVAGSVYRAADMWFDGLYLSLGAVF